MHLIPLTRGLFLGLVVLLLVSAGCNKEPIDVPSGIGITKEDRRKIGDKLSKLIAEQPDRFSILPNSGKDTLAYSFLQTLYSQANSNIRLDINAPVSDRWNQNQHWNLNILVNEDNKILFTLPGGDLYISTGYLKSMEREYEVYYLLAFEACLIDDRFLINRLITEYNAVNIKNLAGNADSSNGVTIEQLLDDVTSSFIFETDVTEAVDRNTVKTICETSLYRPDGIGSILNADDNLNFDWIELRANYGSRGIFVTNVAEEEGQCGTLRTTGAYRESILDILD